jgi:serine/threonine protein kinase
MSKKESSDKPTIMLPLDT